jgi:hypothetical protein
MVLWRSFGPRKRVYPDLNIRYKPLAVAMVRVAGARDECGALATRCYRYSSLVNEFIGNFATSGIVKRH